MSELHLSDVEAMLGCTPAEDRDTWLRCAMAIKSEFGDDGFDTWDAWSQTADNYRAGDAKATWRSLKNGKVSIATLIYLAKRHGWRSKKSFGSKEPRANLREIFDCLQHEALVVAIGAERLVIADDLTMEETMRIAQAALRFYGALEVAK